MGPLEFRSSSVAGVNFAERTIEFIAVPYDQEASVEYRGEMWKESFLRGSWDGIEQRADRVKANRDHDRQRTVGKIIKFWPSRTEGLVGQARIAQTVLGDETLSLAAEDCLGASVGFAVPSGGQQLDRVNKRRRIVKAFMDHLAFVPDPAYVGAGVLSVRSAVPATPALDELVAWLQARKG